MKKYLTSHLAAFAILGLMIYGALYKYVYENDSVMKWTGIALIALFVFVAIHYIMQTTKTSK